MVESLRVANKGCAALMDGDPTGLELPVVEVPGSGRLLPVTGETAGGVTEDIIMAGVLTDGSNVRVLTSGDGLALTVNVLDIVVPVVTLDILVSVAVPVVTLPSMVVPNVVGVGAFVSVDTIGI